MAVVQLEMSTQAAISLCEEDKLVSRYAFVNACCH